MPQASSKKSGLADTGGRLWVRGSREAAFIGFASIALYLVISLFTYHSGDPAGHIAAM